MNPPPNLTISLDRIQLQAELELNRKVISVLWADVVDSTRLYEEFGDVVALSKVKGVLDRIVPEIESNSGVLCKTSFGDAIMAQFQDPVAAVRCAVGMHRQLAQYNQRRTAPQQMNIRVAVNFGLAVIKDGDLFGDLINVAARMQSSAAPGEILISPTVYAQVRNISDLVIQQKATGVKFKGKTATLDLYEVLWREETKLEAPDPPAPRRALDMATGMYIGLAELVRKALVLENSGAGTIAPMPEAATADGPATGIVSLFAEGDAPPQIGRFILEETLASGSSERYTLAGSLLRNPLQPAAEPAAEIFRHLQFAQLGDCVLVEDLGHDRETFHRITKMHRLKTHDLVLIGSQRFRFDVGTADLSTTEFRREYGAKLTAPIDRASAFHVGGRLILMDANGADQRAIDLREAETIIGRSEGITFPDDAEMSDLHVRIHARGREYFLEDQQSATGTFVRLRKRVMLRDGDELRSGQQLFKVIDLGS